MVLPKLLASQVLLMQMFKAALSYLCSFSKVLSYSLGPCEEKMLMEAANYLAHPCPNHPPTGSQQGERVRAVNVYAYKAMPTFKASILPYQASSRIRHCHTDFSSSKKLWLCVLCVMPSLCKAEPKVGLG